MAPPGGEKRGGSKMVAGLCPGAVGSRFPLSLMGGEITKMMWNTSTQVENKRNMFGSFKLGENSA